jgi:hypothetical protein
MEFDKPILKTIWKREGPRIVKMILRKNNVEGLISPEEKLA